MWHAPNGRGGYNTHLHSRNGGVVSTGARAHPLPVGRAAASGVQKRRRAGGGRGDTRDIKQYFKQYFNKQ